VDDQEDRHLQLLSEIIDHPTGSTAVIPIIEKDGGSY
jgi:hypothetical protein